MRKFVIATTLAIVLAGSASAANPRAHDRNPRERDTPIVRVYKMIKRLFTPATQNWPTQPVP